MVITAHANADFDALAAMVAASKLYPDAVLIFPGSQEKNLRNFYIESTTYLFNFRSFKEIDPKTVKQLVVVDTRQRSRIPHVRPVLDNPGLVIHLYDHHPDSDEDLDAEVSVVKMWGSTTTIITQMLMEKSIEVSAEEATMLGLGIYEDTGSFSFNSTTPQDFSAAAYLRGFGMDIEVIADLLSRELSGQQITHLGELLGNAKKYDIHGVEVVVTEITTENFVPDFALLIHKIMDMEDIPVIFALGRMGDRIHMVARSRNPDVNVGEICAAMGGGGHAAAASATIKDKTLTEVRDELFAMFYAQINPQLVVDSLVSRPSVTVESSRTINEAVEIMTRYGLKGIPVVKPDTQECVGLIEQNIGDKAVSHGLGDLAVEEYMIDRFESVTLESDIAEVMAIILEKRQRMLPVIKDGELYGIITRTDLVNLLIEEPARIPDTLMPDKKQKEKNISSMMRNRLPDEMYDFLKAAGELANERGNEVYAVGGFVRDILISRPNFDLDLVVEGDGIAYARALVDKFGGRLKAHPKFKTAVAILDSGQRVDVATARLEYYEYPAALPTVELSSIKMDLYRRDFTVNALALRLNPGRFGQLVDFFGAEKDIRNKTIRVLHSLSFVEDPTRILRAVRFEQRFEFAIGAQTMRLIKNALQLKLFNRLSGSRIMHELQNILAEEQPMPCLERMQELKLMAAIHPLLALNQERMRVLAELANVHNWYKLLYLESQPEAWVLYFLGLTMGVKREEIGQITRRLTFSKREEREFLQLRDAIGDALMRLMGWREGKSKLSKLYFLLNPIRVEGILFMMARSKKEVIRRNISQYLARLRYIAIDISGDDLIAMGLTPGPMFARILDKVMAAKIDGLATGRKEQLELAHQLHALFKAEEAEQD